MWEACTIVPLMDRGWKRDLVISFAAGICTELILWAFFYLAVTRQWPTAIDNVMWLDSLQKPAEKLALPIALRLNVPLGISSAIWIASICGLSLLVTAWGAGVLLILRAYRLCRERNRHFLFF
jgi:hypothetical protein